MGDDTRKKLHALELAAKLCDDYHTNVTLVQVEVWEDYYLYDWLEVGWDYEWDWLEVGWDYEWDGESWKPA